VSFRSQAAAAGSAGIARIQLSHGQLTFTALTCGCEANDGKPVVLCLHGFPDTANTFRFQMPALAAAGYRVVAPMLRGYEPLSQPSDDDYRLSSLAGDVITWLDTLGEDKVYLVGHDWGAAISYVAAALAPERFLSLVTIAVPHPARLPAAIRRLPVQLLRSWYMVFFQLRGIAEYAVERRDSALIRQLWQSWAPDLALSEDDWRSLRATFSAPGVTRAMLAYYRQNASPPIMLGWKQTDAMRLTTVPVPTLAITGADDRCIDTRLYDLVFSNRDFPAGVRVERIEEAGHFAHLEVPDRINALLIDWFSKPPGIGDRPLAAVD
jgi:pimeloyl-ACP methyl ester carboxylesterase